LRVAETNRHPDADALRGRYYKYACKYTHTLTCCYYKYACKYTHALTCCYYKYACKYTHTLTCCYYKYACKYTHTLTCCYYKYACKYTHTHTCCCCMGKDARVRLCICAHRSVHMCSYTCLCVFSGGCLRQVRRRRPVW
jgi:hypothetical protein